MDTIEEIKKLKSLLDQGAITREEFNVLKQKVLSQDTVSQEPDETSESTSQKKAFQRRKLAKYIFIAVIFIGAIWFIASVFFSPSSDSGSSNENSTEISNDDDSYVRDFIISHKFVDIENGTVFTLKFSDSRGGWFGIMTMELGDCWFLYQYETKGRRIDLTFDSSNCTSQGSATTAQFNSDNTISLYYRGQEFKFESL